MGENSNIEWTHHTFNPWIGCTRVSDGCKFCYAEEMMDHRYGRVKWGKGQARSRTSAAYWKQPLKWNQDAEIAGTRARVFCASLADVFDDEVPEEWRLDLWVLISETPNLDWLLLTKRPQNIVDMIPWSDLESLRGTSAQVDYWNNVWLGTTVENQKAADERIPILLQVPAAVRFLSVEPMIGPVVLTNVSAPVDDVPFFIDALAGCVYPSNGHGPSPCEAISWVICGGESGQGARVMLPGWARLLRDQCAAAGVPYLFKQWGEHDETGARVGKKAAGRLLDGMEHNGYPVAGPKVAA